MTDPYDLAEEGEPWRWWDIIMEAFYPGCHGYPKPEPKEKQEDD